MQEMQTRRLIGKVQPFHQTSSGIMSSYSSATLLPKSVDVCPKYHPPTTIQPYPASATFASAPGYQNQPFVLPASTTSPSAQFTRDADTVNFCAACGFKIDRADATLVHNFCSSCGCRLPGASGGKRSASTMTGGAAGTLLNTAPAIEPQTIRKDDKGADNKDDVDDEEAVHALLLELLDRKKRQKTSSLSLSSSSAAVPPLPPPQYDLDELCAVGAKSPEQQDDATKRLVALP